MTTEPLRLAGALALSLGGTLTGEHGVGTVKQPYLADQLGPDVLDVSRRIKAALDPLGVLNPGKVLGGGR